MEYSVKSCSIKQITKAERVESTDVCNYKQEIRKVQRSTLEIFKTFLFEPNVAASFSNVSAVGQQEEVNWAFLSLITAAADCLSTCRMDFIKYENESKGKFSRLLSSLFYVLS